MSFSIVQALTCLSSLSRMTSPFALRTHLHHELGHLVALPLRVGARCCRVSQFHFAFPQQHLPTSIHLLRHWLTLKPSPFHWSICTSPEDIATLRAPFAPAITTTPQRKAADTSRMTPHTSATHRIRADSFDEEDGSQCDQAREMLTATEMLALDRIDLNGSPAPACKAGKPKASRQRFGGESSEQSAPQVDAAHEIQQCRAQHLRNESLHVTWTANDIQRMAKEISDETIADVHLSLLGYWICESTTHYEMAKRFIRELSLDQVSQYTVLHFALSCEANNRLRATMSTGSGICLSVISWSAPNLFAPSKSPNSVLQRDVANNVGPGRSQIDSSVSMLQ